MQRMLFGLRWLGNRIFYISYSVGLVAAFIIALPKILYKRVVYGKYKKDLSYRLGFFPELFRKIPASSSVIWLHGASVGEVRLLGPLLQRLIETYPNYHYVVTACTESGVQTARDLFGPLGAQCFVLPLDLGWIIKRTVRLFRPFLVIFSEGDCWLNFVRYVRKYGAKTVVINGRLSQRSSKLFGFMKTIARSGFANMDVVCVQDACYQQRFLRAGVPQYKLHITGNLKMTTSSSLIKSDCYAQRLHIDQTDRVVIFGSIHMFELEELVDSLIALVNRSVRVLCVLRHVEHYKRAEQFLNQYLSAGIWSRGDSFSTHQIIIVNQMGVLNSLYGLAHIACVGGTFDPKIGGHNLLEPVLQGVPVVFGPYTYSQNILTTEILKNRLGMQTNAQQLLAVMNEWLDYEDLRQEYIERGRLFLSQQKEESLEDTWKILEPYFSQ